MKGATLACPTCGDHIEVMIPADTPSGTVAEHECSAGHVFWSRLGPTSLEALAAPPAPLP
jgi:hypothetical protein